MSLLKISSTSPASGNKLLQTSGITFVVENDGLRDVNILSMDNLVVPGRLFAMPLIAKRGEGVVREMYHAGKLVTSHVAKDGRVVHVDARFRARRSWWRRLFAPSSKIKFIDGSRTPALNRAKKPLKHRLRVARRFIFGA